MSLSVICHTKRLKVRLSRRLNASTGPGAHHPSSCTPPTTSGSSARARPAMFLSQVSFRLGLRLASPKGCGAVGLFSINYFRKKNKGHQEAALLAELD